MSIDELLEPTRESLELRVIRTDGGTQAREEIDLATVDDYAEDIVSGDQFPPLRVFFDGANYWLSDGFHRLFAYKKTGSVNQLLECVVFQGTKRDAILDSLGANARHGLPRSNEDKRIAVQKLLTDKEWSKWSDGAIAEKANVSQPFVSKLRRNLPLIDGPGPTQNVLSGDEPKAPPARKGRDGREVNTVKIGKSPRTVTPAQKDIAFSASSTEVAKIGNGQNGTEPEGWRELPLVLNIVVKAGKSDKRGINISGKAGDAPPIFRSDFTAFDLLPLPPALAALIGDLQKRYAKVRAKLTTAVKGSKAKPTAKKSAKAKAAGKK